MLISKVEIDAGLSASEQLDHVLTFFIGVLPSINKMENVVVWKLEPLNLISILTMSLHDSVSRWLFFIELEKEFALEDEVDSELHWQVWENNVVLGNGEVMDHSNGSNWNFHIRDKLSRFVKQGVVKIWGLDIIAESE